MAILLLCLVILRVTLSHCSFTNFENVEPISVSPHLKGRVTGERPRRSHAKKSKPVENLTYLTQITERSRNGQYLWETGNWAGSVLSTCALMEELTGKKTGPVMEEVINDCPLEQCLAFGKYKKLSSKYEGRILPILDNETILEMSKVFDQTSKVNNVKSSCYRITGLKKGWYPRGSKNQAIDEQTTFCDISGSRKTVCCEGDYQSRGTVEVPSDDTHKKCVGCLPHFFSIGPEKTGTTDLYNRIAMLRGVVPAHRKETGWWNEGLMRGPRYISMAGYLLKYFVQLNLMMDSYDKGKATQISFEKNVGSGMAGRRALDSFQSDFSNPANFITGEATPSMFSYQHKGLSLIARWIRCIYPPAKIIVTLRDPIERTYSDFNFFGKLQEAYVQNLTPETFDAAMRAEVFALRQCFEYDQDKGQLLFVRNKPKPMSCNVIRENQLEMLGFQSKRLPGRLLVSLYPLHLSLWLRYFSCRQLLIVRSEGTWTEQAMREIALFLDVDPASASKAAAATSVRPEQFKFNKLATTLAPEMKHEDMWNSTRSLLAEFFEDHWLARFPEVNHNDIAPHHEIWLAVLIVNIDRKDVSC